MRNVPDVALTADYVYVRADGLDQDVGGTSAAAPLWAGFIALINQRATANGRSPVGFVNPAIYAISQGASYGTGFHDITVGNNTNTTCGSAMFPAVANYDLATGLGSPAVGLIDVLAGPRIRSKSVRSPGFTSSGGVGGPFTVASQSLILTNSGTNSLTWSLANTSLWLDVSSTGGTLTPGGAATTVIVSLNSVASNLVVGTYSATILFTNLNDNVGQSAQYTLAVILPPTIVTQPTNQTVLDGNAATFTVGVTGGLPLSYQWQSNSVNLTDGGSVSGSATSTLVISNVAPAYAANYQVVVTNAAGLAVSSNALLTTLAGNVDHFVWGTIAATKYFNSHSTVSLTALDPANVVATNFNGQAGLAGFTNGAGSFAIEDFESGVWPHSPWTLSPATTTVGDFRRVMPMTALWLERPGLALSHRCPIRQRGRLLSWWIRPSSSSAGRAYLGFGASSIGCWAIVAAPNTSTLIIQYDMPTGLTPKSFDQPRSWEAGKWYQISCSVLPPGRPLPVIFTTRMARPY